VTRAKPRQKQTNQLRIIGGDWRGRKLDFPDLPGLRPTADRIRETLFNWLQADVIGANCLDLFAGSGALGFEALSRGAALVTLVDLQHASVAQIKKNIALLNTERVNVVQADALSFLDMPSGGKKFDIVFLDPPFQKEFLPNIITKISSSACVSSNALIYIETEKGLELDGIPENWLLHRDKCSGQVQYRLFKVVDAV